MLVRNSHDYWGRRQLKWILVGIVLLAAAVGLVVWLAEHEPSRLAFHKYLDAIAAGRIDDAYALVCPASRQAMPDYPSRLNAALDKIGRIKGRSDLGASHTGLGAAFIDGSRMDVRVFMRVTKIDGKWRVCPTEGPLGRVEEA